MLSIYFNRNYATMTHIIEALRNNPDGVAVRCVGTHTDPDSPVLAACDEAYPEPAESVTGADYVSWALEFTARHDIDVFVPRLAMADLADAAVDFAAQGVALLAPPATAVRLLDDKAATYVDAAGRGLPVPPHHVVTDPHGFRTAVEELSAITDQICIKPVTGVGGLGFRLLTRSPLRLADLLEPYTPTETVDRVADALESAAGPVPPLLVMPFLPGPEVSVDVLADLDGQPLATVGREKSRRRRRIVDDPEARQVADVLVSAHRLAYLSNTQIRYWQGAGDDAPRAYLLEVNTRISGGLHQTSLAGVNLAWSAVRLALGQDARVGTPRYGQAYTTVSTVAPGAMLR